MAYLRRTKEFALHQDVDYDNPRAKCDKCGKHRVSETTGNILKPFFYWTDYANGGVVYHPGRYCSRTCAGL